MAYAHIVHNCCLPKCKVLNEDTNNPASDLLILYTVAMNNPVKNREDWVMSRFLNSLMYETNIDVSGQLHGCKYKFNQLDEDVGEKIYQAHPHYKYFRFPTYAAGHLAYGQLVTVLTTVTGMERANDCFFLLNSTLFMTD